MSVKKPLALYGAAIKELQAGDAIAVTAGGTGFSAYAKGDIIFASATNVLTKLAVGTDGYVLTLVSGVPAWAAAYGGGGGGIYSGTGTAFTSYATGDLIYASATNVLSKLPVGVDGKVLMISGGVPIWGAGAAAGAWVTMTVGSNNIYKLYNLDGTTVLATISGGNSLGVAMGGGTYGMITLSGSPGTANIGSTQPYLSISHGAGTQYNNFVMTYGATNLTTYNANLNYHDFLGKITPGNSTASDGTTFMRLNPIVAYTGPLVGSYTGLKINVTETSIPSGPNYLFQAGTGGTSFVSKFGITNIGQVVIGAATVDASAILQVTSNTKGCLFTRMSTTDANSIPAKSESLFTYDTTLKKYKFWNGTAWEIFTSS